MELLLILFIFLLFFYFLYIIFLKLDREPLLTEYANENLKNVSRSLPLRYINSRKKGQILKGLIDGFPIEISFQYIHEAESLYKIHIKHKIKSKGRIKIIRAFQPSSIGEKKIQTGDDDFDKKVFISSTKSYRVNAFMNHDVRNLIEAITENDLFMEISNSWFWVNIPENKVINNYSLIVTLVNNMIAISKDLCLKKDIKNRLLENIKTDPVEKVRYNNLISLRNHFKLNKKIKPAMKELLSDSSLYIQLAAADFLEVEGLLHLENLLNAKSLYYTHKIGIIRKFSKILYKKGISSMIKCYENSLKKELKIEVLKAFEAFGEKKLNPFLIRQLDADDNDIRVHVIEALGTCGRVEHVENLYHIGKSSFNPFIRNAVQKSIGRIQSRLEGVEKGWLSLPENSGKEGGLSISDSLGEGALSISEKDNS